MGKRRRKRVSTDTSAGERPYKIGIRSSEMPCAGECVQKAPKSCESQHMDAINNWGYTATNGPDKWSQYFQPPTKWKRQSPVNLISSLCHYSPDLNSCPLQVTYESCAPLELNLSNTGRTVLVTVCDNVSDKYEITGGPLGEDVYELAQFHWHWGPDDCSGSEHAIDNRRYAAELHLVHWNRSKYQSAADAANYGDGYAVLGVMLKLTDDETAKDCGLFSEIIAALPNIQYKSENFTLKAESSDLTCLLPEKVNDEFYYWTYDGSLTTPPCTECVKWVVIKGETCITKQQLECFVSLSFECKKEDGNGVCKKLVNNARPVQPLNKRVVRTNFNKIAPVG